VEEWGCGTKLFGVGADVESKNKTAQLCSSLYFGL